MNSEELKKLKHLQEYLIAHPNCLNDAGHQHTTIGFLCAVNRAVMQENSVKKAIAALNNMKGLGCNDAVSNVIRILEGVV